VRVRPTVSILLSLLLLPAVLLSVYACIFVPFLFDAPGTEEQAATWIMAGAVLSLPLAFLAALIGVCIAAFSARSPWWYAALTLPFLSLLVFLVAGSFRPGFF
jgi:hypothetical protein